MRWFINRKTSFKLISSFIIIAVILTGVCAYAISNMKKINVNVGSLYIGSIIPMKDLNESKFELQKLRNAWLDIVLFDPETDNKTKMEEIKILREDIVKNFKSYTDSYLGYGEAAEREAQQIYEQFTAEFKAYNQSYDEAIRSVSDGRSGFEQLDPGLKEYNERLISYIDEIWAVDMSMSTEEYHDSENMYSTSLVVMFVVAVLTFALCIFVGLLLTKMIARPLQDMAGLMENVASGDLTEIAEIRSKDEVGMLAQSANKMIINLKGMIRNVLSAAESLSASSEQVSASTEEIASVNVNQANASQKMNELLKELSGAIQAIAQNTEQAAKLANDTIQIAKDGEKVVLSSVDGTNVVGDQMKRLEKDSNRIGDIIEVIDDIADQTNLLALNAAIEAARAGEQGRGFAVVAEEVRKLAKRSGEATDKITTIIKDMQENTALSVKSVQEGLAFTRQSGEAFENIIRMVNDTGNKVTEIAGASEEQAAQSAEVLTFIESISAATEEATASSSETAATSQNLIELAEELNSSVAAFKLS
ncbi:methyl-accepting chemotaxis protein [Siminovitchia terrae]|uniref:Methyl-accepting chemotaxis protein n=1 Tax=Siminovitchia terrae TaxID=1914933 RepID=A0A429X5Q9_SIMTE|nr:methyl-accepting chemotaxis protein [Siminovitchia terrae]RST58709.1 methyl-accepting chemotaxis protein [Siminovitchia terrae]GIN90015.1 methyl-accepting chemotaxis protein [Siminovitchia terrae]GIN94465.1 methyl-accepting chemotaxis protein [Siminovitchia terrae]